MRASICVQSAASMPPAPALNRHDRAVVVVLADRSSPPSRARRFALRRASSSASTSASAPGSSPARRASRALRRAPARHVDGLDVVAHDRPAAFIVACAAAASSQKPSASASALRVRLACGACGRSQRRTLRPSRRPRSRRIVPFCASLIPRCFQRAGRNRPPIPARR